MAVSRRGIFGLFGGGAIAATGAAGVAVAEASGESPPDLELDAGRITLIANGGELIFDGHRLTMVTPDGKTKRIA